MPIILNELHIKMSITDDKGGGGGKGAKTNAGETEGNEAVVAACVEKVMEILKDKEER